MTAASAPSEAAIHSFLREHLVLSFGGNISRLAEACEVGPSMASKWVSEDPRRRVVPSPGSCEKIAKALEVETDEILALAGYRRSSGPPSAEATDPPALAALIAVLRRSWNHWGDTERRVVTVTTRALGFQAKNRSTGRNGNGPVIRAYGRLAAFAV